MLTAIVFGILPALQTTGASLAATLKEGGRGLAHAGRRTRGALIVAEVALAVTLLAGAGLLIKSFMRLQAVDPGFKPEQVLTFELDVPDSRYKEDEQKTRFFRTAIERFEALPGVRHAGGVIVLPLRGSFNLSFTVERMAAAEARAGADARDARGDARLFPERGHPAPQGSPLHRPG